MVFRNPIQLTPQRVTKTSNLPHRRKVNRRKRELNHSIQSSPTNKKLQLRKNQRRKKSLLLKKNQLLKVRPNSQNFFFNWPMEFFHFDKNLGLWTNQTTSFDWNRILIRFYAQSCTDWLFSQNPNFRFFWLKCLRAHPKFFTLLAILNHRDA